MKIILKEDVFKLGSLGDEVEVKSGYARNFLIPQGKAEIITRSNQKMLERLKSLLAKKRADAIEQSKTLAEKLENAEIVFKMKSGESGKLFGSVTQKQIIEALTEKDLEVDRKKLHISNPIKSLGSHIVSIKLHSEVTANLEIKVVADTETETEEESENAPKEEEES